MCVGSYVAMHPLRHSRSDMTSHFCRIGASGPQRIQAMSFLRDVIEMANPRNVAFPSASTEVQVSRSDVLRVYSLSKRNVQPIRARLCCSHCRSEDFVNILGILLVSKARS